MMNDRADPAVRFGTTIFCCALAAMCEGFDLQAAGIAAAGIGAEFKPAADQMGTFFSASTFGLFIGALVGGRLSDSFGRKRVLVASIGVFGLFCLLTAFSTDINTLTWARLLTGLGLGGAFPNLVALISEGSAERRRNLNVALIYAAMPLGGALSSLMGYFAPTSHWRWIFIVGGVVPLIVAPIMALLIADSPKFRNRGALAAPIDPLAPKAGSFLAIMADGRALQTVLIWISFFLGLLTLYLLLNWLPTLLVSNGLSKPQASIVQIAFNLGGSLAAAGFGFLLESPLRRPSVAVAFVALPCMLFWLSRLPSELGLLVFVASMLGVFILSSQAFLYSVVSSAYPVSIRGVGVGVAIAIGRTGSVVGPKLGGILKGMGHGPSQLLQDIVPLAVLGSVTAIILAWYTPKRPQQTVTKATAAPGMPNR